MRVTERVAAQQLGVDDVLVEATGEVARQGSMAPTLGPAGAHAMSARSAAVARPKASPLRF